MILLGWSLESEAVLAVWRRGDWQWLGCAGVAQVKRAEQVDFELRQEERGAGAEGAGGGGMQQAQQHEGDQRGIDLGPDGVLAAPEKAADFEVLLEPFEQELDLPTLFIERGNLLGRPLGVIGQDGTAPAD